jgi:predicted CopG family antitoxin
MKTLHQTFTNKELQRLKATKGKKTWHDFILELADKKPNSFLHNEEISHE